MELVKVESLENAFLGRHFIKLIPQVVQYGLLNLVKSLPKHYHHHSDDIWVILQGKGVFYPTPNTEVAFYKGAKL